MTVRTDKDDIYSWEKEHADTWPSRKVDVTIIEAGERLGVKTIITNPPLICMFAEESDIRCLHKLTLANVLLTTPDGRGNGIGNQISIQIPPLVEISLKKKQAIVLAKGEGVSWTRRRNQRKRWLT